MKSIKKKIVFSFGTALLLLLFLSLMSIYKLANLSDLTQDMYNHPLTVTNATKNIQTELTSMHRYMKDVALAKTTEDIHIAVKKVATSEENVYKEFDIVFERYLGDKKDIQKSFDTFVAWKPIREEVIALMLDGRKNEAADITKGKGAKHLDKLYKEVHKLVEFAQNKAIYFLNNAVEIKDLSITVVITTSIIIFFTIITIAIILLRNLKRNEQTIKENYNTIYQEQEKFKAISELSSAGIYMTDTAGKCTYVNPLWLKHAGMRYEDALGDGWQSAIHEEDKQMVYDSWEKMIGTSGQWGIEYRFMTPDGEITWLYGMANAIKDSMGKITGYIGINMDITELKEKDRQLIQQASLAQMGEMISMIAHQWRQPLSAITAVTTKIRVAMALDNSSSSSDESFQQTNSFFEKNLGDIESFINTMTNTINDFRNFYKPNRQSVETTIQEPIEKSVNIIKSALEAGNIELIESYESKQKITIHDNEIMQVILNLLKNAQDNFLEKKTADPQITITTTDLEKGIRIRICDNGGGIPDDLIDKIFDPYFSTKNEKNGTGLGLYMSKTIVEKHHQGSLTVKNEEEGYLCFTIDLGSAVSDIF